MNTKSHDVVQQLSAASIQLQSTLPKTSEVALYLDFRETRHRVKAVQGCPDGLHIQVECEAGAARSILMVPAELSLFSLAVVALESNGLKHHIGFGPP